MWNCHVKLLYSLTHSYSGSSRFGTVKTVWIHVKLPCSPGYLSLLVVWTDSKLSKHNKFVWNYFLDWFVQTTSGSNKFECYKTHWITNVKLHNFVSLLVVWTVSKHIGYMWNYLIVLVYSVDSGLNRFEAFETHWTQWHVTLLSNPVLLSLLVLWTDSNVLKHIKLMWNYFRV